MIKFPSLTSIALYFQSRMVAQCLTILGITSTYLSIYAVAVHPYNLTDPGVARWGEVGLLDVFTGVTVTVLQSGVSLLVLSPALILNILESTTKTIEGYTRIPHFLARFLFLFSASLFVAVVGWSLVWGSFASNISAVNDYLGIENSLNVSSAQRVLQGFILGGSELALTLSLNASLAADLREQAHDNLRASIGVSQSRPRATAAPGQRPNVPPPQ